MAISPTAAIGTIGGGALEYLVIARAREALEGDVDPGILDIPLGPEIGQCCGGRVEVTMRMLLPAAAARLTALLNAEEAALPHVYVFGAGHVGKALAHALVTLPLNIHVLDTRPEELDGLPLGTDAEAAPMPEAVVRGAPKGSSFVILTHDHALDFMIAGEALKRADAPYIGMIGSKTKRAKFSSWFRSEVGSAEAMKRLVLPIGDFGLVDKRPEVIAALVAAEVMIAIGNAGAPVAETRRKSALRATAH